MVHSTDYKVILVKHGNNYAFGPKFTQYMIDNNYSHDWTFSYENRDNLEIIKLIEQFGINEYNVDIDGLEK